MSDKPMARLWLVRHGQTDWNLQGRVQGQTPTDLNDTGRQQANLLAGFLQKQKFAAVWSSDLPRASQTAEILVAAQGLKVQQSPALRERNFGTLEGKTVAEVRTTLGPGYLKAAESGAGGKTQAGGDLANWTGVPGIETNEEVWVRASVFLREISHEHRGQDVLVVTHGGVLARAVYSVLGIPESMPRHFALSNGLVVILQLKHEIFHLLSLVDYPLAMNGVTTHDTATVKTATELMNPHFRIGCVSFLNSKPLIEAVVGRADTHVEFAVPSHLLELVERNAVSTALLSVVDYQLSQVPLVLVPAGAIGCDGPTLTVRIFSKVPPEKIKRLHGDTDSHTSVILAQVILRERWGVYAPLVPLEAREGEHRGGHETMLLIGDKVVNASPPAAEYPFQLDLGEEWKKLTGLPFVFAMWMMRADAVDLELARLLDAARQQGAEMTDQLLDRHCAAKGWPRDLARRYFTEYLKYKVTPRSRQGLAKFYNLAAKHNLLKVTREPKYLELIP